MKQNVKLYFVFLTEAVTTVEFDDSLVMDGVNKLFVDEAVNCSALGRPEPHINWLVFPTFHFWFLIVSMVETFYLIKIFIIFQIHNYTISHFSQNHTIPHYTT